MRRIRFAAKVLLTLIVLCETVVAWRLWRHGPPMEMVVTSDRVKEAGELSFKMVRVSPSASDWAILVVVVGLQVALLWFIWWSRRKVAGTLPAKG